MRSKKQLWVVMAWVTLTVMAQAQSAADEINQYLETQNYSAALALLQEQDSSLSNWYKSAFCHQKLGNCAKAKQGYERILIRDSLHLSARVSLGNLYFQEANWPKAIRYYRELIGLDSTNFSYYKSCGDAHEQAGLVREAFGYWEKALHLNPQDIPLLINLAEVFLSNKQTDLADSLMALAYDLDKLNVKTLLQTARVKYSLKNYAAVSQHMYTVNSMIDLNPFYKKMWAYAMIQLDSIHFSIRLLEGLLNEDAEENTHFYLGLAYEQKKNYDYAIFHYRRAISKAISPNMGTYYLRAAILEKEHTHFKEAIEAYREGYRYTRDASFVFYEAQVSDLYYKQKNIALNKYQEYLKLQDTDHPNFTQYARERVKYLKEYLHQTK